MTKVSFTLASVTLALLLAGALALFRNNSAVDGQRSRLAQIRPARVRAAPAKSREPERERARAGEPVLLEPVVEHAQLTPSRSEPIDAGDIRAEAALMAELRALGSTDAERSLTLAREGNARFPATGAAPERARVVVKSLVGLRRFHEAREEARRMVLAYPRTPETLDVERHLLVYPLDQPSREQMQADMRGAVGPAQ